MYYLAWLASCVLSFDFCSNLYGRYFENSCSNLLAQLQTWSKSFFYFFVPDHGFVSLRQVMDIYYARIEEMYLIWEYTFL